MTLAISEGHGGSPDPSAARFYVAVHDVAPNQRDALAPLLHELTARLGGTFSMAITPRLHDSEPTIDDWAFLRELGSTSGARPELLLHGLTHRRRPNPDPISIVNRFSDEWSGLPRDRLHAELGQARALVRRAFGRDPVGVVAPCWRWGAFDRLMMREHELAFAVGYRSARFADPAIASIRLTTASRDWGFMTPAHPLLAAWPKRYHRLRSAFRRQPEAHPRPCIVFHPVDVRRGSHWAGLREIDRLVADGMHPSLITPHATASTKKELPAHVEVLA